MHLESPCPSLYIHEPHAVISHILSRAIQKSPPLLSFFLDHLHQQESLSDEALSKQVIKLSQQAFQTRFPSHTALLDVPPLKNDHLRGEKSQEQHGRLVRLIAMVQHESLSEQYYIPLVRRADLVSNLGIFKRPLSDDEPAWQGQDGEILNGNPILARKMAVVMVPPGTQEWCSERGGWPLGREILVLCYGEEELRINHIYEFIGIFEESIESSETEWPHGLPHLHLLMMRSLENTGLPTEQNINEKILKRQRDCRECLLNLFGTFGLDLKASTLLLASLLSKVSLRRNGLLTSLLIGTLPINLIVGKDQDWDMLIESLSLLMPRVKVIRMDGASLENVPFTSRMDYEQGRLLCGELQVADGTLLIIDERSLSPGKLSEMASQNLNCLIELVTHQMVHYDFAGHLVPLPCDLPIIILSHGKSILPVETRVNLVQSPSNKQQPLCTLEAQMLADLREYLQECRSISVRIPEVVGERIEEDYLAQREQEEPHSDASATLKKGKGRIKDGNDLSRTINLARLICSSYAQSTLEYEHYQEASSLLD